MGLFLRVVLAGFAAVGAGTVAANAGCLTIGDLQGSWKLVEIQSKPVQTGAERELPMFTIKDQSIEGFDGCNRFSGRLDQPAGIFSTQMGCPDGTLKLPLDLADPMSHLKDGRIDNRRLTLPEKGDLPSSAFQRIE